MRRPELLAPAGDLERLRIALRYGADAVYLGGQPYSLRSRTAVFPLDSIREGVLYAHSLGKKVYVTVNAVFREEDLLGLRDYLDSLDDIGIDGVIVTAPAAVAEASTHPRMSFHLSTQQSVTNLETVRFWAKTGIRRIVLARELDLGEIAEIVAQSPIECEVFIHGGMCSSYSGRCTLSNEMTGRDANRGGCAHSCRWTYSLVRGEDPLLGAPAFSLGAKDLQAVRFIPALCAMGVASLKIEGRMKSPHYVATVVSVYRRLIDDVMAGRLLALDTYDSLLARGENRPTGPGFFEGIPGPEQQLSDPGAPKPSQSFVAIVEGYDPSLGMATVSQRNVFSIGDLLEHFSPAGELRQFRLIDLRDAEGMAIERASHPQEMLRMSVPWPVEPLDMFRKVN